MNAMEQFINRLNTLPQRCNAFLKQIKTLDNQAQATENALALKQANFLKRVRQCADQPSLSAKNRQDMTRLANQIKGIRGKVLRLTNKKIKLAAELYDLVHEPTETLDTESNRLREELNRTSRLIQNSEQEPPFRRKYRRKHTYVRHRQNEDNRNTAEIEPKYCYCQGESFGQMVMCENSLCEKEWFHRQCLSQRGELPDKWYCRECRTKEPGQIKRRRGRKPKKISKKS